MTKNAAAPSRRPPGRGGSTVALASLSYTGRRFAAAGAFDERTIALRLSGDCDVRAVGPLEVVLKNLHAEAQRLEAHDVAVDLEDLEFMNSACLKKVLTWLSRVQTMGAGASYRVRLLTNPKRVWQRKCLHAVRCFAVDLVTLETR